MTRSVPYRHQINEIVNWNQIKASNETFFILREIGPVGFIVQEEGHENKYKVCLGDPHSCSCKDFKKEKDLCKHICWTLLKKFRVDKDDPISWQLGLNQREINDLIFSKNVKKIKVNKSNQVNSEENQTENTVLQRKIEADDICPICQDDLLNKLKPVTFCRNGCGNNIHIRCMSVWSEHKKKELNLKMQDSVPCPICRGEFGTMHLLMVEMMNSKSGKTPKSKVNLQVKQIGLNCTNCNATPIIGKAYKCNSCTEFFLCSVCFNNSVHENHEFVFREHSNGRWLNAPNSRGMPASLINGLQNNDLESVDYTLLQQLDKPGEGSNLRQQDLNQFSTWTITAKSKLSQPGHQCRICLMSYKLGDIVRKLPRCQHIFHLSCIDPWLLHRTANCPIDEIEVCKLSLNTRHRNKLPTSNPNFNQNNSHSHQFQSYNERQSLNQINELSSALSIASINCRPSSSSEFHKYRAHAAINLGSLVKSAIQKPRHLPPLAKPTNNQFESSFSITSIKTQKHSNQE